MSVTASEDDKARVEYTEKFGAKWKALKGWTKRTPEAETALTTVGKALELLGIDRKSLATATAKSTKPKPLRLAQQIAAEKAKQERLNKEEETKKVALNQK